MKLSSKTEIVVVTGASTSLGRAIVQEFARDGASVGLLHARPRTFGRSNEACSIV